MAKIIRNGVLYGSNQASDINYSNTSSGLTSTTVQAAVDEVNQNLDSKADFVDAKGLELFGWIAPKIGTIADYIDASGIYHKKIGRVDLGTLTWSYNSTNLYFTSTGLANIAKFPTSDSSISNLLCEKYNSVSRTNISTNDKCTCMSTSGGFLYIKDTSYTDADALKTAMNGVYLYYELATEETKSIYTESKFATDISALNENLGNKAPINAPYEWNQNITDANDFIKGLAYNFNNSIANCPYKDGTLLTTQATNNENIVYQTFIADGAIGCYFRNCVNKIANPWQKLVTESESVKTYTATATSNDVGLIEVYVPNATKIFSIIPNTTGIWIGYMSSVNASAYAILTDTYGGKKANVTVSVNILYI